jgi:hypothetical protein
MVGVWEAEIEALSIWQNVMTYIEQLERQLLDEILVFPNLVQIPAVILTGGVAWIVCGPIRGWAVAWIPPGSRRSPSRLDCASLVMGDRPAGAADHADSLGHRALDLRRGRRARRLAEPRHPDRCELTVSHLFSGIVLLLDESIKQGDVIEVGGTYGWVSSLGARYVSVKTRDSTEFLIPDEDIITHQVVNWSHRSDRVRRKGPVRVPQTPISTRRLP